jgi:hypothetical protein
LCAAAGIKNLRRFTIVNLFFMLTLELLDKG